MAPQKFRAIKQAQAASKLSMKKIIQEIRQGVRENIWVSTNLTPGISNICSHV